MDDLTLITALMAQNSESVGFIPYTTVSARYLAIGRYIIQHNPQGQALGYLLHGAAKPGEILTVAQHCIEADQRLKGYGEQTFETLLERAKQANCRAIKVRCASTLPAVDFWRALGFKTTRIVEVNNIRNRTIEIMLFDLWPRLI